MQVNHLVLFAVVFLFCGFVTQNTQAMSAVRYPVAFIGDLCLVAAGFPSFIQSMTPLEESKFTKTFPPSAQKRVLGDAAFLKPYAPYLLLVGPLSLIARFGLIKILPAMGTVGEACSVISSCAIIPCLYALRLKRAVVHAQAPDQVQDELWKNQQKP